MKKQIAIATLGLAVLSTSAFASKARLEALGQDADGSQFLDDERNVLLNPAHLNYHKDFVTMEFGDTQADTDEPASPRAEGGMFKASGNMVYGIYFGNENDNAFRSNAGVTAIENQNNTDFFIAGDAGIQWGARLSYHQFSDKQQGANQDHKSDLTVLRVGVISGDTEAFLKYGLTNKAEDGAAEFEMKSDMDLGVTHSVGDIDYILRYISGEYENAGGDANKFQNTHIGVARNYKLNDKAQAWASAFYKMDTTDDEIGGANETKNNYLPVVIGLEYMAKEWLTLRGSVGQQIIGENENNAGDKATNANTTFVAAGASLVFGDMSIDGLISNNANGNGSPAAASATDANAGRNTAGGNGTLRTDALMSRVSMTYKF